MNMNMPTIFFRQSWRQEFLKEETFFRTYSDVYGKKFFMYWDRDTSPEVGLEMELKYAIRCLGASEPADCHLTFATEVYHRAITENKCQSDNCRGFYPGNIAKLRAGYAYVKLLQGQPLDKELLVLAAPDLVQWYDEPKTEAYGQEDAQGAMLRAARMDLICGQAERAKKWLMHPAGARFKYYKEEHRLLKEIAANPTLPVSEAGIKFFDAIRDPAASFGSSPANKLSYGIQISRFEWAILILKHAGREVSGKAVIEIISA